MCMDRPNQGSHEFVSVYYAYLRVEDDGDISPKLTMIALVLLIWK